MQQRRSAIDLYFTEFEFISFHHVVYHFYYYVSMRHQLRAQSQGHHTIDHLKESGVERGSARRSSLKGRERAIDIDHSDE